jgi:exodeoxyribonuclease VII small subunit
MSRPDVETLSYKDASAELEGILRSLESDRLDVDQLAAASSRALALVERCRSVLLSTQSHIDAILPAASTSQDN